MGREFELKFAATASDHEALRLRYGHLSPITMETTYYDTPAGALSARHFTLRKRLENGKSVCTLKTPAGNGARGEWETECDTIEQAIPILCKLGGPEELLSLTEGGVIPVCGARFTRRYSALSFGESTLELALDEGVLFNGEKQIPLCEVEIELKDGSMMDANTCAAIFRQKYGLTPEQKSKFLRAKELGE
jgi:inorganic triphosphatase YgiF